MHKITAIVLAFIFVLYLGGMEFAYYVRIDDTHASSQQIIHSDNIAANALKEFTISTSKYNALAWVERNKEFDSGDKRYDVIDIKFLQNGTVKMQCYNDVKEADIVAAFSGFIKRMFSTGQQTSKDNGASISANIYKDYTYNGRLALVFFSKLLTTFTEHRVLVNATSPIASIWHPPCA